MSHLYRFEPTQYTTAPHQSEGWIVFRQSPEKVFARVADHAALGDWIPLVQEITVTHPHPVAPGECTIGAVRRIIMKGGLEIIETVVYWNLPYWHGYKTEGKHLPDIHRAIERRPVMTAGSSDGDIHMFKYAKGHGGRSLALLVHHDDAAREYAYDGGSEKALQLATKEDWIVVSMKNDWKTVF